jgi:hypothetical protein
MITHLTPTDYQNRVLEIPEHVSLILDGGRGSGKTKGLAFNAIRHCELHGERAHVLFVREHLRAMSELEDEIGALVLAAFPKAKHNRQDHTSRLPGGGTIEFAPISCAASKHGRRSCDRPHSAEREFPCRVPALAAARLMYWPVATKLAGDRSYRDRRPLSRAIFPYFTPPPLGQPWQAGLE